MPPCDYDYKTTNAVVPERFNPCFSGCRPATTILKPIDEWLFVSILVLVDAALRHCAEANKRVGGYVFQSLF